MLLPSSPPIFTVSRLNQTVRQLLEMEMGQIWLSAEISNFSQPSSGHWYFTLKDARAQVRCAMFRTANRKTTFQPQNGQQVLVRASITLYEPRGDYQLIAESMQPAGDGLLQQRFEQLKQRLSDEGLFEQSRKRPLPSPATCIGIITSKSGAALHDILHILQRRDPSLPVIIYPTMVQGADATLQIARTIELANQRNECDVLIVGRGGGSLEDLWCFNEELVARAIANSNIPVVSAVGHETDVTIADFVADLRAPTPSAAAEMVSRNQLELVRQLQSQQQRLEMAMDYYFSRLRQRLARQDSRLQQQHPQLRLSRQQTTLLKLQNRLEDGIQLRLRRHSRQTELLQQRLMQTQPQMRVQRSQQQLQQFSYQLQQVMERQLNQAKQRFSVGYSQLEAVSPLATLARGYSVTSTNDGATLKKTRQVKVGDKLKTRLSDGWVESSVSEINKLGKQ
ncbi:exodeoxyribonuclease VII large subunit [Pragia fontium]|uniref:exodeoxyribonuclease VII large subunit n=1 Tax=Pragia fontium TaxID=82985 RepID=UPI00064932F3|nr:exodeoxyribonuclease VII large subunit [Pragia fontium]AKJ42965.1 exodeoxyribonuclease VII large subunit [Pragia fontium]